MSKNKLDILFQSDLRVKILKFIFRNPDLLFGLNDLHERIQDDREKIAQEIDRLLEIQLLYKSKNQMATELKSQNYSLNRNFEFFSELRDLVLKSSPAEKNDMVRRLESVGRMKLVIISGIFVKIERFYPGVVDLFVVADDVDKRKFANFLKKLEAEVGKEVTYSLMERDEFQYRLSMFDRFVTIMLESPHEKLVNKLEI